MPSTNQESSPSSSPVRDVSRRDFATAVIARSHAVPVVVDFWAPWCGPCRVLGPRLEREVATYADKLEMVKVNTDENPELAAEYQIQSVPAVKAFVAGQVAAEFVGAHGVESVRAFLRGLVPSKARTQLTAARKALSEGRPDDALPLLREALSDGEIADQAAWELARLLIAKGRAADAEPYLARLEAGPGADKAAPLRRLEHRTVWKVHDFRILTTESAEAAESEGNGFSSPLGPNPFSLLCLRALCALCGELPRITWLSNRSVL